MGSPRAEVLDRVRAIAERVAGSYALDVFDVQFRREAIGWVLRVIVDRPGPADGSAEPIDAEAVGVDDCQRVSRDLSAVLDVEGEELEEALRDQSYTLEVSSPGLDRPLRGAADYRRFAGRLVKVVTREPVERQTAFAGRLQALDGDVVVIEEGRRLHRVPLALIVRGRLEVEF